MAYAGLAVYDANGNQIFGTPTRTFKKLGSFKTSKALAPNKYGTYSVYQDYTDNNITGKNICYYISGIKWIDNVSNARVYNSYPAIIKIINGNTFRIVWGSDQVVQGWPLSYYELEITYGYL